MARRLDNPTAPVAAHLYVVRPGDTLWSIAQRLDPGGDPRSLVAQLEDELNGATLVAGEQIQVP
jgi:hypothetical protein